MDNNKIHGLSILHRLLIAFLLVFVLVCSALTTTYYLFSRNSIVRYANEAILRELDAISETFQNTLHKTLPRELKLLSASPLLDELLMSSANTQDINRRALERLFLPTIKYFDGIERIRFIDSRGTERVVVDQQGRVKKYQSIQESTFFTDLENSAPGSIVSTKLLVHQNGDFFFSIGTHKTDPDIGEFGGAIILDYNLRSFLTFTQSIKIFGENPVWIFSPAGQVLTKPSGKDIPDPRPFPASATSKGINVYTHQDGLVATSDLEIIENSPFLKVCLSIPNSLLYRDIQRVLRFLAIVFAVSFLLIVIAVFFISNYLSQPLIKLAQSVQKLSLENFSQKIDIHATGEVGLLVHNFNTMSQHLKKTTVSRDYVDSIFHAMANSLIVLSPAGLIETVNAATLSLLGYQEEEVIGQPFSLIVTESVVAEVRKNENINKRETSYRAKNGHDIPMLFSSSGMYNYYQDELQAIVCLAFDISDKKQMEQEKELLEAQLRQAHKMEAIGTLAGGIAHDFNNILTAVLGYAELARLSQKAGRPVIDELSEIIKAGTRAKDLVRQILTFSRNDQRKTEALNPYPIVAEALKLLRSTIPSSIEITENLDKGVGIIQGDPMKIHQIVMNLCTNAAQAMETSKGIITVTLAQKELNEEALRGEQGMQPGQYVELSVRDTGKGIDLAIKDRIFDPFFTTKEVGSGTGMGLAVVHGIVKEYGGLIRVTSAPATGTSFHVYFSVIDRELPSDQAKNGALLSGCERILIVDDEKPILDIMERHLLHLGYEVTACNTSTEAVAVFSNDPGHFDLIITDQTMPQMLGTEMAKEMLRIRPEIPIILCSGYSSTVSEETSKDFGITIYLPKPVDFDTLSSKIRDALAINR